ncbi:hypothetical protein E2C01_033420 [Portunus trituberculatus]|uniref:Uncharacterized protein n=1 Tax=Portunus trituberculatus TaxID=210409 RepID=A0A5B7EXU0_PORTR|nr:hypothetical protein [Portunus trituberculatus]
MKENVMYGVICLCLAINTKRSGGGDGALPSLVFLGVVVAVLAVVVAGDGPSPTPPLEPWPVM